MNQKLKEKILESLSSVLPVAGIVLALSVLLVPLDVGNVMIFLVSTVMLIVGMGMFQLGAETAMNPLGEGIGGELSKSGKIAVIIFISFVMGVLITIAEPDLQVLSNQVPSVPNSVLIWTVAVGVGLFLAVAVMRVVLKINLSVLLMIFYAILLILSFFVPKDFLAVAFDSGGVTTGPMTVPFIMAMGIGLSAMRGDKDASSDSFGLVALSSIGPILAVMVLGCFYAPKETADMTTEIASVATMRDVVRIFVIELPHYAKEVLISLLPIAGVYVIFQLARRKYQKRQRMRIAMGFLYTYVGLVLFLCGVNVGFAPIGTILGSEIAGLGDGMAYDPDRHDNGIFHRKSRARDTGPEPSGAVCYKGNDIRKDDEPLPVHRRCHKYRSRGPQDPYRAPDTVDNHTGVHHSARNVKICAEDLCRYRF